MEAENRPNHANRISSSLPAAIVLLLLGLATAAPALDRTPATAAPALDRTPATAAPALDRTPSCRTTDRFSPEPCFGRKPEPSRVEDFLARPSRSEWKAQLELGWGGSDGSTAVPDVIGGVRIGATSRHHDDVDLPANRHDWYYELGRSYGLGWRFRRAADQAYRDMCLERVQHLDGLTGALARADIRLRYAALRVAGLGAWLAHPGPAVPPTDASHIVAAH